MKDRIISEINRLAELGGGKAPGQKRFEKETGIKVSSWRGKIWAKWSDAVSEAGHSANTLNASLNRDKVLDDYAEVCREYGRPPTYAELRLYGRERPDFMGVNTYRSHFANKDGVITALRARATQRCEQDLLEILPEVIVATTSEDVTPSTKLQNGWVYLLQSGNHFKIGRSNELEKRVKQISVALPEKVELVHAIETDDPPGIEAYWHRRFEDHRANGEWFKLSPADVRAFKRRKFQ